MAGLYTADLRNIATLSRDSTRMQSWGTRPDVGVIASSAHLHLDECFNLP